MRRSLISACALGMTLSAAAFAIDSTGSTYVDDIDINDRIIQECVTADACDGAIIRHADTARDSHFYRFTVLLQDDAWQDPELALSMSENFERPAGLLYAIVDDDQRFEILAAMDIGQFVLPGDPDYGVALERWREQQHK